MLPREFLRENAARLLPEMPERFGGSGLETYPELDAERREAVTPPRGEAPPPQRDLGAPRKARPGDARRDEDPEGGDPRARGARGGSGPQARGGREAGSQRPAGLGSARHRRVRQPRRAHLGRAAPVRLRAAGALGPRPGARHPRLRARRQDRGRAVHGPRGRRARGSPARSSSSFSTCTSRSTATARCCRRFWSTPIPSSAPASFPSSSRISSRRERATTSSPRPRSR